MNKLIKVTPKENFVLYLKYSNGTEGEISCADLLKKDEYRNIRNWQDFKQVKIDKNTNDISWPNGVSMCKNAMYRMLELKNLMKSMNIEL